MKKPINLLDIYNFIELSTEDPENTIKTYLQIQDMKDHEISCLHSMCKELKKIQDKSLILFEHYYINYKIPQIGKEFDLLRFEKDRIINIELKSKKVEDEKLLKQLKQNYHYLSPLKKNIYCYVFLKDENKFYMFLSKEDSLEEIGINELAETLDASVENFATSHPDYLFVPTNYLISPFNNTEPFLNDQYFLTNQQEEICKAILKEIDQETKTIFSISGQAGTGKTLLTYHLAKKLMNKNLKVLIVHCAKSNEGISILNDRGWNIKTIKEFESILETLTCQEDIIIFDESQRLKPDVLQKVFQQYKQKILIFSHDAKQRLNKYVSAEQIVQKIKEKSHKSYELKNKIRHNQEIAYFVKKLFDPNNKSDQDSRPTSFNNILLHNVSDLKEAEEYIRFYENQNWKHIHLTPGKDDKILNLVRFSSDTSAHQAIGQEWDNVIVVITPIFYYTDEGKIHCSGGYYNPLETLFQALTRTRKKLCLIAIKNPTFYKKCIEIITDK